MLRFGPVLVSMALAVAPVQAYGTNQTRLCPLPVVGGDADRVSLGGRIGGVVNGKVAYVGTIDESVGEASHVVSGVFVATSSDGGRPAVSQAGGSSPAHANLVLDAGKSYTVQWVAAFDYGIHPCSSVQPGQAPFTFTA